MPKYSDFAQFRYLFENERQAIVCARHAANEYFVFHRKHFTSFTELCWIVCYNVFDDNNQCGKYNMKYQRHSSKTFSQWNYNSN